MIRDNRVDSLLYEAAYYFAKNKSIFLVTANINDFDDRHSFNKSVQVIAPMTFFQMLDI